MRKMLLLAYKQAVKLLSGHRLGRFRAVAAINNFILSHLKSNHAEVQGHRMFLDPGDSLDLSIHAIYERLETELVKKEIKKGDVVLDIGAHIGYYTFLKKNIEINGYTNVIPVQKAATNKTGKIKLYLCEYNKGMHRIYESRFCSRSIEIESIRLDDYFKDYRGRIDFIKLDVEGSKFSAVEGMPLLLRENSHVKIMTEYSLFANKEFGIDPGKYPRLLEEYGFNLYCINKEQKRIEPITVCELLERFTPEKENFTNLLCIKEK